MGNLVVGGDVWTATTRCVFHPSHGWPHALPAGAGLTYIFRYLYLAQNVFRYLSVFMYLSGIFISVKNKHYIKKGQAYVIAPNHSSYLDIVIIYQTFTQYFVFMGKKELAHIPLFNIFFKKMNVPVDRKSNSSGKRAMDRCALELDKGHSVVLFPEGTIPSTCPKMGTFKNGAFKLAIEKQVPILPITFISNYRILEMSGFFTGKAGPGLARAVIHEPISTIGLTEADLIPLRDKVFEIISKELEKYQRN